MTLETLNKLHNKKIKILGESWTIKVARASEENCIESRTLEHQKANMLTEPYMREIWINIEAYENDDPDEEEGMIMPDDNPAIDQDITHELYHAFYMESGLDVCTGESGCENGWARNETMIDWNAKMFPKILKVRRSLGVSDNF